MRFTNLTRHTEIGANSYLLELADRRVVLDCGMHPKHEGDDATPNLRLVPDGGVDAIFVSHAHLDHIGSLPVLMRRQPRARVFMSGPTAYLGEALLHNSVNVMARPHGFTPAGQPPPSVPTLFTHREADQFAQVWQPCALRQLWNLDGERLARAGEDPVSFEFFDAGHILGSVGILFRAEGKRVFYAGDVNFADQTVSQGAEFPDPSTTAGEPGQPIDCLIMETTRGDHPSPPGVTRADEEARLAKALKETFAREGAVLLPVFALGKTQEILAILLNFKQRGLLGDVPIYIGGLSTKMTEIYDRYASSTPRKLPNVSLLHAVAPYVLSGREAGSSPIRPRRIYALSSGMMTEKTLSNLFARRMLADERNSVFFVGYADPESPAGKLRAAAPGDLVQLDEESPAVARRAQVEVFDFSAHSKREEILDYILRLNAKKTILVHGDPGAVHWFKETLAVRAPGMEVVIPPPGEAVEI